MEESSYSTKKGKFPEFVRLVKEELQKENIKVEEKDLETPLLKALERAQQMTDCWTLIKLNEN